MQHRKPPMPRIVQMLHDTDPLVARGFKTLRSLVMMQDQSLLCARGYLQGNSGGYKNDCSQDDDRIPVSIAPIHSVTKSVVALLTGILVDRGLIAGVDQPLSDLLGTRSHYLDGNTPASQLTLHHLLSMTSGFLWRDARVGMEPMAGRMMQQSDWVRFAVSLPVTQGRTGSFQYNSAVSHLLSVIIEEAAGVTASAFADENLFSPLGITEYEWESDPQGINIGGWGLSLSPLSLAKLGQLCLDNGRHKSVQLVSAHWIQQMWTPHSEAKSLHGQSQPADYEVAGYGYQWWVRGNNTIRLYCAEGLGGQKILCIPDLRAVIVTSCDFSGRRTSLWPLIEQYWIPSLIESA